MREELELFQPFVISLAIGLMMGLERERREHAQVGLRSFALIALLGTVTALLSQQLGTPWLMAVGLPAVAAILFSAREGEGDQADPDHITLLAAALCYCYGALLYFGQAHLVAALAFATTSLMYFKAELHGITRRLTRQDLLSFLQFILISAIVLPVLPDAGYGPYQAINPYKLWLMVVLISGLSLAGYVLLRMVGPGRSALWLGVLGGAVSSTMTTVIYSRHLRASKAPQAFVTFIILTANLVVGLRLAVLVAVMGRDLLLQVAPVLGCGIAAGSVMVWLSWRALHGEEQKPAKLEMSNPAELRSALTFAGIYGLVLLATAWLHDVAGDGGVYVVALISGLTDVDAITLSVLQMNRDSGLNANAVELAIVLAYISNMIFKAGIGVSAGGRALLAPLARGYGAVAVGLVAGIVLIP